MTLDSKCIHWWIIGEYLVGRCKKCGATKDFEKLREEEKTRSSVRRAKMHSPVVSTLI
jgi:hypothetical protein